jgi:hypothetical protein
MKIKYVGRKDSRDDNVASTGLVWKKGQVHEVSPNKAALLLLHPDIWKVVKGGADAIGEAIQETEQVELVEPVEEKAAVEEDPLSKIDVAALSKAELQSYAIRHSNVKLDSRASIETMREQVSAMMAGRPINETA